MAIKKKKAVKKKSAQPKKPQSRKFVVYFFKSKQGGGVAIYKNPNVKDPREQQRMTFKTSKEALDVFTKITNKYCQDPIKGLHK